MTALVVAGAGLGALFGASPAVVALVIALAFLPYAGLLGAALPSDQTRSVRWAVGLAAGAGAVLVAAPSLRVLGQGIDPYLYAPDDPALYGLRDELHGHVNNPEVPTIYPPFAQLFFWVASLIDYAPWAVKALALVAHLGTIPLVARLAASVAPQARETVETVKTSKSRGRGDRGGRAALLYGLNPLALTESALGGHVDVVAGLALAAFALALVRGRGGLAAVAVAVATGTKLIGLVVAPLVALRSRRAAVVALALSAAVAAPIFFAGRGSDAAPGVGHYARRWSGNSGLFLALEAGAGAVVDHVAEGNWSAEGRIRLPGLEPVVTALMGTPFDPWQTQLAEKKEPSSRTIFERSYVSSMLARVTALLLVFALAFLLLYARFEPLGATRAIVFAVLLLAPQLHPWYLLWLLPLEAAAGRGAGLVFSAAILATYAPIAGWARDHVWVATPLAAVVAHGAALVLLASELGLSRFPWLQRSRRFLRLRGLSWISAGFRRRPGNR
ncbi:MAG: DUF2029 domain-containing protein [Deltaproteobacteria bacterium]|nr:DUF2029 domain-containing protein [Deltaproteobacteria bacterium]